MELFDISQVWYISLFLEYLRIATEDRYDVKGGHWIYENLKSVRNWIQRYKLHDVIVLEMDAWLRKLKRKYKGREKLKMDDAEGLLISTTEWRRTLLEIFINMKLLKLRTKGRINYLGLLSDGPESFFEKETNWNKLSIIAKRDLKDAVICLLSIAPTPSVMLCLRVIEGIFRKYYKRKTGREVDRKRWADCVDDLRKKSNVNQTLIGHLDFIRKFERNPAQHPDKRFSDRESENIFLRCIEVIEEMYEDSK